MWDYVLIFWHYENCLLSKKTLLNFDKFFNHLWHSPRPPEREVLNLWKLTRPLVLFCSIGLLKCLVVPTLVYKPPGSCSDAATSQSTFAASVKDCCSISVCSTVCSHQARTCSDSGGGFFSCQAAHWGGARGGESPTDDSFKTGLMEEYIDEQQDNGPTMAEVNTL